MCRSYPLGLNTFFASIGYNAYSIKGKGEPYPSALIFTVNECGKYKEDKGAQNKFVFYISHCQYVTPLARVLYILGYVQNNLSRGPQDNDTD